MADAAKEEQPEEEQPQASPADAAGTEAQETAPTERKPTRSCKWLVAGCCAAVARMFTRRTWRFLTTWYSLIITVGLLITCLIGIEKMASVGSGCCDHSGAFCCPIEELRPINVSLPAAVNCPEDGKCFAWAALCVDGAPVVPLNDCLEKKEPLKDCLTKSGHSQPEGFSSAKCLQDRTVFEGFLSLGGLIFAVLLLFAECLNDHLPKTEVGRGSAKKEDTSDEGGAESENAEAKQLQTRQEKRSSNPRACLLSAYTRTVASISYAHSTCVAKCHDAFFHLFGVLKYAIGRSIVFLCCGSMLMLVAASNEGLEKQGGWFIVFLEGAFCVVNALAGVAEWVLESICAAKRGASRRMPRVRRRGASSKKEVAEALEENQPAEALEEGKAAEAIEEGNLAAADASDAGEGAGLKSPRSKAVL